MIGGGGIGMLLLVLAISYVSGRNPLELMQQVDTGAPAGETVATGAVAADDPQALVVGRVLESTEEAWSRVFADNGTRYQKPVLVLFDGSVGSACGSASSAVGPFYCPSDRKVYLDMSFFRDLDQRFAAPGDFAQAYVIAHEVGHHVQTLLGISSKVNQARSRMSEGEANQLSVRQELQADCYAGVWAANAKAPDGTPALEPGDVEEGMKAAEAIGDDRLQQQSQGRVSPESFTHGTSAQRMAALRTGLQSGNPAACKFN